MQSNLLPTVITGVVGALGIIAAIYTSWLSNRARQVEIKTKFEADRKQNYEAWLRDQRIRFYGELVIAIHTAFERWDSVESTDDVANRRLSILRAEALAKLVAGAGVMESLGTFHRVLLTWTADLAHWVKEGKDEGHVIFPPDDEFKGLISAMQLETQQL